MADATCAGCGCVCDDGLTCALGDAWFDLGERPPLARVDGREVSLDEAVAAAAAILRAARAPLIYGLGRTSIEAQRRAVGLAEALGAVIDPGGAAPFAYQSIGASTATFGEIRDRAELVVAWRADPALTHPRLLERLRVAPESLVVVDADGFEALWELRRRGSTGAPLRGRGPPALDDLARRLLEARHVAFIHGALDELAALALASLVRDLSRDRHAVTLGLRADGNARGAEDVLAWQTGFAGGGELRPRPSARGARRRRPCSSAVTSTPCSWWRPSRRRPSPSAARAADRGRRRARHRDRRTGRDRTRGRRHRGGGYRPPDGRRPAPAARAAAERSAERRGRAGRDRRARLMLRIAGGTRLRPRERDRRRGA